MTTEEVANPGVDRHSGFPDKYESLNLVSENSKYDSDCYDETYFEDEFEGRAESAGRLYILIYEVIANRGSNQEKFNSRRHKALVKYGKCDVPGTPYDVDEEAQVIIQDTVDKYNYFASVNGAVRSGERSVFIHSYGHGKEKPKEYLLKVYRLSFGMQKIGKWVLNEYVSAWHMSKHVNVPNTFAPMKNVVIMDFIGDDGKPAPSLNEVTFKITEKMHMDVIMSMYKMFNDAERVHGKLSGKTILWWRDKVYFVGLSRAVESSHPNALCLLMKDCCHITHFFKSKGLPKVKSILNLYKFITGLHPSPEVLLALKHHRRPVKHKQKILHNKLF